MSDTFLIIDGNSLLHRAFHALPVMDNGEGVYTNAIHGFMMMLLKAVRDEQAAYLAVCFDEHGPTFRHEAYAEYKAGRQPTPPELKQQFGTIRQLLDDMGIRRYGLQGWEADDLLGTLSRLGTEAGVEPLLLTGDRDALQLVGHGAQLLFTRKGLSETIRFTPAKVYEEYGFTPEQVTDWKGLAGDSSDNIPGIAGIGDKTAVKLLQQYGTLENVLAHAGEVKGKLGEKLAAGADQARMCKELATIRRDAPVDWHLADCALPDLKAGIPALQKLHLNQVIRRIAGDEAAIVTPAENAPVLPEYGEPAEARDAEALTAWMRQSAAPFAICVTDTQITLASGQQWIRVTLGGDLLNPGADPGEILRALGEGMAAQPAVVHDGKRLLHTLRKAGAPLPERFDWDTMLGAYLLNPQEKSYAFVNLKGNLPDDREAMMDLIRKAMSDDRLLKDERFRAL